MILRRVLGLKSIRCETRSLGVDISKEAQVQFFGEHAVVQRVDNLSVCPQSIKSSISILE
jgi:hypothetical protein